MAIDPRGPVWACWDPLRGPHNRCRHLEAPPAGTRRCAGDPACPFRLPLSSRVTLCPGCSAAAAIRLETPVERYERLMSVEG